ncbi:uncharacterized protein LOC143624673 [Bidens hawaiensis]|uniref:uncharacterized protein LOC143624673 n=1 Tax=Bidens hawaiensis TaxID=980011 RepID=UPI004049571B
MIVDTCLLVKLHGVYFHTRSIIEHHLLLDFHFIFLGQQQIVYGEEEDIDDVLDKASVSESMFIDWMTINGMYPEARNLSYVKDACYELGLLDDDNEYIECIVEASNASTGFYLRNLFCTMLMCGSLSRPEIVWEKTWNYLAEDIIHKQQQLLDFPGLSINEEQIKNLTLLEIEKILLRNNSSLRRFNTMSFPDLEFAVEKEKGGAFFVYGYGGTGKTFLWKTLELSIRSKGLIVLNVASSGIASLLLTGGRTAHSRFKISINLTEDSICSFDPQSEVADLIKQTSLIIWDEAPMIYKHAFEAMDRTFKDILKSDSLFGDKVVVFGGDFRQILPVVTNGSRHQIVNAFLSSSYIWKNCKVLKLTKNMRLTVGSKDPNIEETRLFAEWLLKIGEGKLGGPNHGEVQIDIPYDILIKDSVDPTSALIEFVYPSILQNYKKKDFFQERAILAPKNEVVQEINDMLLARFPGEHKEYLSFDSIDKSESINEDFDPSLSHPMFSMV